MIRNSTAFSILLVSGMLFLVCCNGAKSDNTGENKPVTAIEKPNYGGYESQVKWGEHLVTVGACGDCHTPKKMSPQGPVEDSALLLSGHPAQLKAPDFDRKSLETRGLGLTQTMTAWEGPWGISYTANLTSDQTGIGNWSEDQFIKALREGKSKGLDNNRMLLPPMPWTSFRNFRDDELKAIFAYLKSTKPIKNLVPPPTPPLAAAVQKK